MMQLLDQSLLFQLDLRGMGHVLEIAAAAQIRVPAFWRLPIGRRLQDSFYTRFDKLAAGTYDASGDPLAGQTALDEGCPPCQRPMPRPS